MTPELVQALFVAVPAVISWFVGRWHQRQNPVAPVVPVVPVVPVDPLKPVDPPAPVTPSSTPILDMLARLLAQILSNPATSPQEKVAAASQVAALAPLIQPAPPK